MHFITGTHIPRRTFLRGAGATVALPLLDAMIPAGRVWSRRAAAEPATRLVAIEMVHGAAGCNEWGATQYLWSPEATGRNFDLSPSSLLPLEPYRDRLTIISNTDVRMAEARMPHEIGGDIPSWVQLYSRGMRLVSLNFVLVTAMLSANCCSSLYSSSTPSSPAAAPVAPPSLEQPTATATSSAETMGTARV